MKYGVVEKPTSMSYQYGDAKWVGMNKFCEALIEDPRLLKEMEDKVIGTREAEREAKRVAQSTKKMENE